MIASTLDISLGNKSNAQPWCIHDIQSHRAVAHNSDHAVIEVESIYLRVQFIKKLLFSNTFLIFVTSGIYIRVHIYS